LTDAVLLLPAQQLLHRLLSLQHSLLHANIHKAAAGVCTINLRNDSLMGLLLGHNAALLLLLLLLRCRLI
jgi:hypothetical protein